MRQSAGGFSPSQKFPGLSNSTPNATASLNYAIAIKSPQRVASATSGLPVDGRSVGGNGFTGEGARGDGGPHCSIHPLRQDSCKEGHSDTYISRRQFPRDLESLAPLPKRRAWQF